MIDFNNTHPDSEGWGIFDCYCSDNGPWQLQKCDEMDVFPSDDEAWLYVTARAAAGSAYHQSALDFIKEHNPLEYDSIMKFVARALA